LIVFRLSPFGQLVALVEQPVFIEVRAAVAEVVDRQAGAE